MRGSLHELLNIGDSVQRLLNDSLVFLRKARLARKLLNIIAIRLGTRHAAGGSMGLFEKAGIRQVCHNVAYRSRT